MTALPRIISVDDHVLEPPDLWWSRLPTRLREQGPHVVREKGAWARTGTNQRDWVSDPDADGATWSDVWHYDDLVLPLQRNIAAAGFEADEPSTVVTYEQVRPGTFQRDARLDDMDANHTDVSICFPNMSRFCGQMFLERADKDVALPGVEAYNDWMIDDWCGHERPARLVPLTIVPLWDPELAAAEVYRCAAKGSHAMTFSESPPALGLPSIYSGAWDPLFRACEETDTVISVHVGSSSKLMTTAADAPADLTLCFLYINAELAFCDWLYSGVLQEFPGLKLVLSESQVGWMPFAMQRLDNTWKKSVGRMRREGRRAAELPSSVVPGRVFGCIFDDLAGLKQRDAVGLRQILVETDYPHTDSTYPHSEKVLSELVTEAGLSDDETTRVLRTNAIAAYGLDRYFGITS
jgi:predicted TIM-barrel fold metal-dependent hydrolase